MVFKDYAEFEEMKLACDRCPLRKVYDRVVASEGNKKDPAVVIVGEAPGADEVREGRPFVGKAGQVLRNGLRPLGFTKLNTLITNTIPCRPPDNQYPADDKLVFLCMAVWLWHEFDLLKPKVVLLLGAKALRGVLGLSGVTANRGRWFGLHREGWDAEVMATYHPSYVMRLRYSPEGPAKIKEWTGDLEAVAAKAGLKLPQ